MSLYLKKLTLLKLFTRKRRVDPIQISPEPSIVICSNLAGSDVYFYALQAAAWHLLYTTDFGASLDENIAGGVAITADPVNIHVNETGLLLMSRWGGAYRFFDGTWHSSSIGLATNLHTNIPRNGNWWLRARDSRANVSYAPGIADYPGTYFITSIALGQEDFRFCAVSDDGQKTLFSLSTGKPKYSLTRNDASAPFYVIGSPIYTVDAAGTGTGSVCCDMTPSATSAIVQMYNGYMYGTSTGLDGSWFALTNFGSRPWKYCEISDDGLVILAITDTDLIFYSRDFGTTVRELTSPLITGVAQCTISGNGLFGYIASASGTWRLSI